MFWGRRIFVKRKKESLRKRREKERVGRTGVETKMERDRKILGWDGEGVGEGGSGWGTHVYPWQIHVKVWQNHYNRKKNTVSALGLGLNILPKRKLLKACYLPGLWRH